MYKSTGPVYTIGGQPIEVFPFWPNYTREFLDRWEWKTEILTAYNGDEQRIALRSHPRRSFEYQVFAQHRDKTALNHFLQAAPYTLYGVPDWNLGTVLRTSEYQDVVNYLSVPTRGYVAGGYLVGFIDPTVYELRQVTAVDEQGVQIDGAVSWPKGTHVYPVTPATLPKDFSASHTTGLLAEPVVQFSALQLRSPFINAIPQYPEYLGFPVVEEVFDRGQPSSQDFTSKIEVLDNGTNTPFINAASNTPYISSSKKWFLNAPDDILRFQWLIHFRKGRFKPFWMPSDTLDFIPVACSGVELVVKECGYTRLVADKNNRQHIRAVVSGAFYYRKITSSAQSGELETLTLDEALPGLPSQISFMVLSRFDSDRIEIAYSHPHFARASTAIRTLNHYL